MLALEFFKWWYGQGWALLVRNMRRRLVMTSNVFSVPILIRTLFAPWRRIITYGGAGINSQIRTAADNLVSRLVGFVVRLFVLFTAGVSLVVVMAVAAVEIAAWPLLPIAVFGLLVKGVIG